MKIEIIFKGEIKNEKKQDVEKILTALKTHFLWYQTDINFKEVKAK